MARKKKSEEVFVSHGEEWPIDMGFILMVDGDYYFFKTEEELETWQAKRPKAKPDAVIEKEEEPWTHDLPRAGRLASSS